MSEQNRIEPLFTAETLARRISELGAEIRRDVGNGEAFLLGILKGTSCFLADLMRATPGAVTYGFIDVVRDIADTETAAALQIDYVSYTAIAGRHVYLLKDVVSTGVIENYLLSQLRLHRPATLKLVALLDRPELRTVDLKVHFRGFKVEQGTYVGYGLEQDDRLANLPYIGRLMR